MNLNRDLCIKLVLAAGVLLFLNLILPWEIPVLKLVITFFVAWLAWQTSDNASPDSRSVFFSSDHFRASGVVSEDRTENGRRVCRYVFSSASVDLTDSGCLPERMELQSAFSSVSVRLPVDANITIHASGAFCSIAMPGQQNTVLGERTCCCGSQDPHAPRLHIDAACAFGSISFRMG